MKRPIAFLFVSYLALLSANADPMSSENETLSTLAEDLVELVMIEGVEVSPDGSLVALRERLPSVDTNTHKVRVRIMDAKTGFELDGFDVGHPWLLIYETSTLAGIPPGVFEYGELIWSPDNKSLATEFSDGKSVRYVIRDLESQTLHTPLQDVRRQFGGRFSADGAKFRFMSDNQTESNRDAIQGDLKVGARVATNFLPLSSKAPLSPLRAANAPAADFSYNLIDQTTIELSEHSKSAAEVAQVPLFKLVPAGDAGIEALLSTVAFNASGNTPINLCSHAACSGVVELLDPGFSSENVVFLKRERFGRTSIYQWTPSTDALRELYEGAAFVRRRMGSEGTDCSRSDASLYCAFEYPLTPSHLVKIDLSDFVLTDFYNPNSARLGVNRFTAERLIWENSTGQRAHGFMVRKANATGSAPLVVVQYECDGFLLGGTGGEFPVLMFAELGMSVLCFDSISILERDGFDPFEDDPAVIFEARRQGYLQDADAIRSVIDSLVEQGDVEAGRVGITGLSYGSGMSYHLSTSSDDFAALATSLGTWDPSLFMLAGPLYQKTFESGGFGYPRSARDVNYDLVSPSRNLSEIKTPALLQVADNELLWAMPILSAYDQSNVPAEVFVFEDEWHIKRHPRNKYYVFQRYAQWFAFWLLGQQVGQELEPGQFERWRSMQIDHCAAINRGGNVSPTTCRGVVSD